MLISQRHYVLSMLFKFGMIECKSVSGMTCDAKRFLQIVGSLMYLTITRPDLSYPTGLISQFMSQPNAEHLQCEQRIL